MRIDNRFIYLTLFLGLCAFSTSVGSRELVVTMQSGQRIAFHLSSTEDVVMTQSEEQVFLNGTPLNRADVKEFRIFQQLPVDAIPVGVQDVENGQLTMDNASVFDLSGRRVADSAWQLATRRVRPRAGVYLINNKKVVVK